MNTNCLLLSITSHLVIDNKVVNLRAWERQKSAGRHKLRYSQTFLTERARRKISLRKPKKLDIAEIFTANSFKTLFSNKFLALSAVIESYL